MPIQPIYRENGPNWQCSLAGSSKTAPRILIFSIAMGADYSFELNSIETYAPQFFGHNNLFLGSVHYILKGPKFWVKECVKGNFVTFSFSKVFLCFLMGKKSTPEYYCSCTPVNFYYVNVFLYDVLIDITLFSEMFFYLIRDYFKPKNWNPETYKDLAYVCTTNRQRFF